jgi:hypothetical protein
MIIATPSRPSIRICVSPPPAIHACRDTLVADSAENANNVYPSPLVSPLPQSIEHAVSFDDFSHNLNVMQGFEDDMNAIGGALAGLSPNEVRARKAVQYALVCNSMFDKFHVGEMVGYGSNGVVLSAYALNDAGQCSNGMVIIDYSSHSV